MPTDYRDLETLLDLSKSHPEYRQRAVDLLVSEHGYNVSGACLYRYGTDGSKECLYLEGISREKGTFRFKIGPGAVGRIDPILSAFEAYRAEKTPLSSTVALSIGALIALGAAIYTSKIIPGLLSGAAFAAPAYLVLARAERRTRQLAYERLREKVFGQDGVIISRSSVPYDKEIAVPGI